MSIRMSLRQIEAEERRIERERKRIEREREKAYKNVLKEIDKELKIMKNKTTKKEKETVSPEHIADDIKMKLRKSKTMDLIQEEILDDGSIVLTINL